MNMETLGIGWVDLLVVTLLIIGVVRGRKRGMSEEVLDVIKWVLILGVGSLCYAPIGGILSDATPFSRLSAYLTTYLVIIAVFMVVFSFLKRQLGGKILGSDTFGNAEYYLGMCAGGVRYASMIFVAMALLHARYYSPADVKAELKYQIDTYGSNIFPGLCNFQHMVFTESMAGRLTESFLPVLLIKPTAPEDKGLSTARLIKAREKEVFQVLEK